MLLVDYLWDNLLLLIACGADKDKQDFDGWTPLHAAAENGHLAVCKILCESGADITIKNYDDEMLDTVYHDGLTPEQVALQRGHFQVASAIASYGTCLRGAASGAASGQQQREGAQ